MMSGRSPAFVTTRWTRVVQARGHTPEAAAALRELCDIYYEPVLTFVRVSTRDDDRARDLTHEFFARLLARNGLGSPDPARGRFRSYLLAAVKNFLRDAHAREHAARRCPPEATLALENENATSAELQIADQTARSPDREFDRKWALTVLGHALQTLEKEQVEHGRGAQFQALKPWLSGEVTQPQNAVVEQLNLADSALRVAVHRLRRRFRALVQEEIACTLQDPTPQRILEELEYLITVVA